jgi:hypothetical protein
MVFSEDSTLFSLIGRFDTNEDLSDAILKYVKGTYQLPLRSEEPAEITILALVSISPV